VTEAPLRAAPARFRLRAFEADWIQPLRQASGPDSAWTRRPSREWNPLRAVLIAEAQSWVRYGLASGYFAGNPDPVEILTEVPGGYARLVESPPRSFPPLSTREFGRALVQRRTHSFPPLSSREFGRALAEAQEDLTPYRREFLYLASIFH
jgi:hypothetical protein